MSKEVLCNSGFPTSPFSDHTIGYPLLTKEGIRPARQSLWRGWLYQPTSIYNLALIAHLRVRIFGGHDDEKKRMRLRCRKERIMLDAR
jgi:hypothetical protein